MRPHATGARASDKFKVFISYSRKDLPFAFKLLAALEERGFQVRIDTRDLPALEDWRRELSGFIREADAVVFIISPHFAASPVCEWEVNQAVQLNKRLAPIVLTHVDTQLVPEKLTDINFIFFDDENSIPDQADKLATALKTDARWVKEHTRLAELARRWSERGRTSLLRLRGHELSAAELWLRNTPPLGPQPTAGQRAFIEKSRQMQRYSHAAITVMAIAAASLMIFIERDYLSAVHDVFLDGRYEAELFSPEEFPGVKARYEALSKFAVSAASASAVKFQNHDITVTSFSDAWTTAQETAALPLAYTRYKDGLEEVFRINLDTACNCWKTIDKSRSTTISSWVIMSYSARGLAPEPLYLQSLLARQSDKGWWPEIFDALPREENASIYATAIATYALLTYKESGLADAAVIDRINKATASSLRWIRQQYNSHLGGWRDYTTNLNPKIKRSVTALIIAIMAKAGLDGSAKQMIHGWLTKLADPVPIDMLEYADEYVGVADGATRHDTISYVVSAWEIAALDAVYGQIGKGDKIAARLYFKRWMSGHLFKPEMLVRDFVLTESYYALTPVVNRHFKEAAGDMAKASN